MNPTRRDFLKISGGAMALPWLDSFGGFAHAEGTRSAPQRLLMICLPLGIYRDAFAGTEAAADPTSTEYLSALKPFRDQLTVITGLDHPGVNGGHSAAPRIFTGIPANRRNARSLDQYVATHIGTETRFDSLALSAGSNEFSWTDSGTKVPSQSKMANLYANLFVDEGGQNSENVLRDITHGKSIMELVRGQAKALRPKLSPTDQQKLDEYFDSVGETERRLTKAEGWVHTPKPKVRAQMPQDPTDRSEITAQMRNVCDMTHLAFKTDSTRVITFGYFQQNVVNIPGVSNAYHALSHHGKDPNNVTQLKLIERGFFVELGRLLRKMHDTKEGDSTLLDRTTIVVTSNLGNASNHSNKNLPVLLLGGKYNHGRHLAFEPGSLPLSNLYLSILHQFGIADKTFATSTAPLAGLA
ncbi:MAG: hypothetical protein ACI9OD_003277 [Limisphaerales bacterium]|jgi:hypothetical protein